MVDLQGIFIRSSHHLSISILLISLFVSVTSSQCQSVKSQGVCMEFSDYMLPVPNKLTNNSIIYNDSISQASSLLSCPGFLSNNFKPLPSLLNNQNLDTINQLYPLLFCQELINSSPGRDCNPYLLPIPPVCPSTCINYWSSYYNHLSNSSLCPDSNASRQAYKKIIALCTSPHNSQSQVSSSDSGRNISNFSNDLVIDICIDNKVALSTNCGFNLNSQGKELKDFCDSNPHIPCCLRSLSSFSLNPIFFEKAFQNPWFLAGFILIIIALVLIVSGLYAFFRARKLVTKVKRLNYPPTTAFEVSPEAAQNSVLTLTKSPGETVPKSPFGYQDSMMTSFSSTSPQNSVIINHESESQFLTTVSSGIRSREKLDDPIAKVYFPYLPVLPDELHLEFGDYVIIQHRFDDGWGLGRHNNTGAVGAFPMACLQIPPVFNSIVPNEISLFKRNTSIMCRTSSQRISRFLPKTHT